MTDYYKILGVGESASQQEIKKAYRKLSLKFHPDRNDGDPFFENLFKEVQEAYQTLGNEEKRRAYDLDRRRPPGFTQRPAGFTSSFEPVIDHFSTNTPEVADGEVVTFSWSTRNADLVVIKPFGTVPTSGEKMIRLKQIRNEYLAFEMRAIQTGTSKYASKTVILRRRSQRGSGATAAPSGGRTERETNRLRVFDRFWSVKGRLSRWEYFARVVFLTFLFAVVVSVGSAGQNSFAVRPLFWVLYLVALSIQTVKRLHDLNRTGWLLFLTFVPLLNLIFTLYLFFAEGTRGPNAYGPPPN